MVTVDRWTDIMALVRLTDLQTGTLKTGTRQTGTLALVRLTNLQTGTLANWH